MKYNESLHISRGPEATCTNWDCSVLLGLSQD
jgi:hypothetical protein